MRSRWILLVAILVIDVFHEGVRSGIYGNAYVVGGASVIVPPMVVNQLKVGNDVSDVTRPPDDKSITNAEQICASLCSMGLGGGACEATGCFSKLPDLIPEVDTSNFWSDIIDDVDEPRNVQTEQPKVCRSIARNDACPVLCENGLGVPLCRCYYKNDEVTRFDQIHWDDICQFYCYRYAYYLEGCPETYLGRCQNEVRAMGLGSRRTFLERFRPLRKLFETNVVKYFGSLAFKTFDFWRKLGPSDTNGTFGRDVNVQSQLFQMNLNSYMAIPDARIYEKYDWNGWCLRKCDVNDGGAACNCDILPI